MIDYATVLQANYAGSQWLLVGNDYSGLTWLSDTPQPTKAALDAAWPAVQADIAAEADGKAATRASGLAKLKALGLTDAEVVALVGG